MSTATHGDGFTQVALALIAGGGLKYLADYVRDRKRARDASPREVDANILTVSKARDALEADNTALRQSLREERQAHTADRAAWAEDRTAMRGEIEALESKLRALLAEVADLRNRHNI